MKLEWTGRGYARPDLTLRDGMPLQHLLWWLEDRLEDTRRERSAQDCARARAAFPDLRVS